MILELELSPLIFFPTLLLRSDFKSDILMGKSWYCESLSFNPQVTRCRISRFQRFCLTFGQACARVTWLNFNGPYSLSSAHHLKPEELKKRLEKVEMPEFYYFEARMIKLVGLLLLFYFLRWFLYVALAVLEFTLQTRLASNSEILLPLPSKNWC